MTTKWFEIPLDVRNEHADEAVALLAAEGFAGCEVREGAQHTRLVVFAQAEDADAAAARACTARAAIRRYLAAGDARAESPHEGDDGPAFNDTRAGHAVGCDTNGGGIVELDPAVWTDNWRRHFSRRTFADRIEVLPPWETPSAGTGLLPIVINPGMAFGTGLHETTASCLEVLVELVRPGDRVADVGCGSGILALAALRLGAAWASATDIDPLAVDATLENAGRNGLLDRLAVAPAGTRSAGGTGGVAANAPAGTRAADSPAGTRSAGTTGTAGAAAEGAGEPFDLVVANILAETLVELHGDLTSMVREGGVLVLSGIENSRLPMVLDAFVRPPWTLLRRVEKGEWATVAIQRTTSRGMQPAPGRTVCTDQEPGGSAARGIGSSAKPAF